MEINKYVYSFDEGAASQKKLLGGKGANLSEMVRLGIPVPHGFTITTQACNSYLQNECHFPGGLWEQVLAEVKILEEVSGKQFGGENPLLVSVRSGAPVSMPGMMDTILNLGLNDTTVKVLAEKTQNETFAYDSYRRFIQMFSNVVLGMEHRHFEAILSEYKNKKGIDQDIDMKAFDWQVIVQQFKQLVEAHREGVFPEEPMLQLELAVKAVFNSWLNPRAISYRKIYNIEEGMGTAVNIQSMVFGNMGVTSGTGVCFTRDPSTGEKIFFGEFLLNAQGEDVVAGIRTPEPIALLQNKLPKVYEQLSTVCQQLESHFRDMQDIEFTIENEKLYLLQTRSGKRSAPASLRIAVDLVEEGLINQKEALLRIEPQGLDQLLHPQIAPDQDLAVLASGLPASPGAGVGQIVFDSETAEKWVDQGKKVILVRQETSPEDVSGMNVSSGILTTCGGMTSHAAVVARGLGKPCVSGANGVVVNEKRKEMIIGKKIFTEGDKITLDGSRGAVIAGTVRTIPAEITGNFSTVMSWADEYSSMQVRTNADTPEDAQRARDFGARGIGLCRTEHMFFEADRIRPMREMILAETEEDRQKALEKLLPFQREDFYGIFKAMDGFPVTIRLLDPPLHEFLPVKNRDIDALATELGIDFDTLKARVLSLHEVNPMLGHRGCRLMMTYPEIAQMQAQAILEAASQAQKDGIIVFPEIMVPLVGIVQELKYLRDIIESVAEKVFVEVRERVDYKIGTMIEVPRACLVADEIASVADFFSFGTNDLTQMTFGYSRDDVGKFLPQYKSQNWISADPFETLDEDGVGKLVRIGVDKGRRQKSDLKIGICGEHGGDPQSVNFCFHQDLNYVSCSPFRVPIARIASAQSYIRKWQV